MGDPAVGNGRRNKNRGYQQLRVWQESIDLYRLVCETFRPFPFELKKVASQNIAAADSIHRNIAEGYSRRSVREYIQFLHIALGSLAELVSGVTACHVVGQIDDTSFENIDSASFKLENGLLKLVECLERKRDAGTWNDSLVVRELNALYGASRFADETAPI